MTDRPEMKPRFEVGEIVRIKDPDAFLVEFGTRVRDRDAVVMENILDYQWTGSLRTYQGRVRVEFQKRNGRGKTFVEVMHERNFISRTRPLPEEVPA